jgi:hypothetical protein
MSAALIFDYAVTWLTIGVFVAVAAVVVAALVPCRAAGAAHADRTRAVDNSG